MIHLSYHPAFDAFHTIFRILRVKDRLNLSEIEIDKLRILDYYMLFPWRAVDMRLSQSDLEVRRIAKRLEYRKDYATLPKGEALLERMRVPQLAALQTMAQDGAVDANAIKTDRIRFLPFELPADLSKRIVERNDEEADVLWIIERLSNYKLLGPDGLKGRTSLLEHRYDKI